MRILGIDPGIAIVGYGVVDYKASHFTTLAHGAILTPAHTAPEIRLEQIYAELSQIIELYRPEAMAVEELFFNTNRTTAIVVAEARGVILLCAKQHHVPIFEYTPLQVKQSVVGYGRADKKQVIYMVQRILNLEKQIKLDDTADALAIAICHAHTGSSRIKEYYNLR